MSMISDNEYVDFCPKTYLLQYYSHQLIPEDELLIFRELTAWLRKMGRQFEIAVEVGCGPTLHHAFPLAPWVNRLVLCDYVKANRVEVRNWLNSDLDAHNWQFRVAAILSNESNSLAPPTPKQIFERENLLRSKVVSVEEVDLRSEHPLGIERHFDLVTSFYTSENVAKDFEDWKCVFARLSSLCKTDGSLFTVLANESSGYQVGSKQFATVKICEEAVLECLNNCGFSSEKVEVKTFTVKGWEREGIHSIIVASASRS